MHEGAHDRHPEGSEGDRIARLEAAVADLTAEVQRLRAAPPGGGDPERAARPAVAAVAADEADVISRRTALRHAGKLAAGTVAAGAALATLPASPAAAATVTGSGNPGVNATGVGGDGLVATTDTSPKSGVYAYTSTAGAYGVYSAHFGTGTAGLFAGQSDKAALEARNSVGPAVRVTSNVFPANYGVKIDSFRDSIYASASRYALEAYAITANLMLRATPREDPTVEDLPIHEAGEVLVDNKRRLWFCVKSGTDSTRGSFRILAGSETAGSLHLLPAPVRVYDSRPGTAPNVGPKTQLAANQARVVDLTANASSVPPGATGALLTVLLVNAAAGNGNFTVWANGVAKPFANTMVWGGNAARFTATAVSAIDAAAKVQVSASLHTDVVVDVVGFYR